MAVSPSPADSGARRNAADKVDAVREPNAAELCLFMITVGSSLPRTEDYRLNPTAKGGVLTGGRRC